MGIIIERIFTFTNPKRCMKMLASLTERVQLRQCLGKPRGWGPVLRFTAPSVGFGRTPLRTGRRGCFLPRQSLPVADLMITSLTSQSQQANGEDT